MYVYGYNKALHSALTGLSLFFLKLDKVSQCQLFIIMFFFYFSIKFQFYSHANSDHLDLIAHEWVSCGICKVFLPTTAALKHHKSVNHCGKNSLADRVQCRYCHNSYLTAFQLYKHANKTHLVSDQNLFRVRKFT